ncbi:conjugative transposon protein TraM [Nubsella zeaxanthinifaciens]|uniref:conjugative transposon protein TraM n=1 Tax=Nubsella zeaxanthinifaciens TaxID=392412 RepID=UPI000DE1B5F2|nr:conjugative transposon protein TraM [Nubsella zeaxanthinifaciens]
MEKKKRDKRKLLLVLPLLVIPFLALGFYALGGGGGNAAANSEGLGAGINTSLPDASFKGKEEPKDKMGFYRQAERDSSGNKDDNGIKAVADRLGFAGQEEDPQTRAINEKLKALNVEMTRPAPVAGYAGAANGTRPQPASMKGDVDRLEALMKTMQSGGKGDDPEMAQLASMMDKIIAIQNPNLVQEQLKQLPVVPDSAFRAIPAVIEGNQKVAQGAVVKLRLTDTLRIKNILVPKNQLLFGACNITNQRLLLNIRHIRLGSSIIPVDLSVFSLDGLIGIDAPEAELGEAAGNGASSALQGMQLLTMEQSLGVQAAGAGIDAAKNLLSRKVKRIRVKLKGGQQVLLRNNEHRP